MTISRLLNKNIFIILFFSVLIYNFASTQQLKYYNNSSWLGTTPDFSDTYSFFAPNPARISQSFSKDIQIGLSVQEHRWENSVFQDPTHYRNLSYYINLHFKHLAITVLHESQGNWEYNYRDDPILDESIHSRAMYYYSSALFSYGYSLSISSGFGASIKFLSSSTDLDTDDSTPIVYTGNTYAVALDVAYIYSSKRVTAGLTLENLLSTPWDHIVLDYYGQGIKLKKIPKRVNLFASITLYPVILLEIRASNVLGYTASTSTEDVQLKPSINALVVWNAKSPVTLSTWFNIDTPPKHFSYDLETESYDYVYSSAKSFGIGIGYQWKHISVLLCISTTDQLEFLDTNPVDQGHTIVDGMPLEFSIRFGCRL
tara:strand:+ start:184 stop:1296 length:1113 start_codon:yes stop_codon:yes gene_type:complete